MSDYVIKDQSSNHHYRTELPNIIFEIGLSPQLIGVYSALKRSAGDHGACTRSEKKLAEQLHITKKTLHGLIIQLCEENSILKKPLIKKQTRFSECGDQDTNLITINDIWPENYTFFTLNEGGRVKITPPRVKITQGVGENLPYGRVKITHKEEPFKKNLVKEPPPPPSSSVESATEEKKSAEEGADILRQFFDFIQNMKKLEHPFSESKMYQLCKNYSGYAVQSAMKTWHQRNKKAEPLRFPDKWLEKQVIVEHEFHIQKKEYNN
jgi:hypothetical protein